MEYSDSYLREYLPRENPSFKFVPPEVLREVDRSRDDHSEPERSELVDRSIRWTYAIFSEFGLGNYSVDDGPLPWPYLAWLINGGMWPQLSVGLFDPSYEHPDFGLILNVPNVFDDPEDSIVEMKFPRLNRSFPLIIRQVTTELHAAPNPTNATSACWGRCNRSGQWGIITAGHAVGSMSGVSIPLDDGTSGISHRCYWQPVDAAFVLAPNPPIPPIPLAVLNFPAAGLAVEVHTQSGAKSRTVAAACNSLGFYQTRQWPVNFFLDQPCVAGDSGSLVSTPRGEACGIYIGAQPSPDTGGTSGLALNFAQAMFALETTPYE